jgi:hypothetical protein
MTMTETMTPYQLIKLWDALSDAVRSCSWTDVERIACELEVELAAIARDRAKPGPPGDAARDRHRDGIYAIGWQRVLGAPASTRAAVSRFNEVLRQIPGGVGPQPRKRMST